MALFGDKLEAANAKITALTAALAAAGVTFEGDAIPTADAVTAKIKANNESAIEAAVTAALAEPSAETLAFRSGMSAAGLNGLTFAADDFKLPEGAEKDALNPAATKVKEAIETKVAAKATKQIASTGHPHAIETPTETGAQTGGTNDDPQTAEEFKSALNAIEDPGKRTTYFRKHKAKFIK